MNLNKVVNTVRYIGAVPRSIYINFRLLPFNQALKLPILVSRKTVVSSLAGRVRLKKVRTGLIRIGFGSIPSVDYKYQRSIIHIDGEIIFHGKCKMGRASKIIVQKDAILELGENFNISGDSKILCNQNIRIGNDSLLAWESIIMDTDFHKIYDEKKNRINENREIVIGNKVWIGARTMVLKGSKIANNSIVASNSTVTKEFANESVLLAGSPAKIIKENISWEI